MKSLYEGILQGMDKTISNNNAWKEIYPIPSVKDFYKAPWSSDMLVRWDCPELIQKYIDDMVSDDFKYIKRSDITGLLISICNRTKLIDTYLTTEDWERIEIKGVGDWVSDKLPEAKKKCIEFLQKLVDKPDNIIKLIEYNNKCVNDLNRIGFCNKRTFEQLLK